MTRIAVCNPKGGVGKTTISLNLAVMLISEGLSVKLFDLDRQASLSDCIKQRPNELAALECVNATVSDYLAQSDNVTSEHGFEILDCPAGIEDEATIRLMHHVDKMIIPANASRVDVNALIHHVFDLASHDSHFKNRVELGLVVNRAKNNVRHHQSMINWYDQIAIPTIGQLRDTVNYSISTQHGIGIVEMPSQKVKKDVASMRDIYDWAAG